jgi:hypothetical protein
MELIAAAMAAVALIEGIGCGTIWLLDLLLDYLR